MVAGGVQGCGGGMHTRRGRPARVHTRTLFQRYTLHSRAAIRAEGEAGVRTTVFASPWSVRSASDILLLPMYLLLHA